jgi:diaminopimelate decarboxylase
MSVVAEAAPARLWRDLDEHLDPALPTPRSVLLSRTALDHWAEVREAAARASTARVAVNVAYSIKTNPRPGLLRMARSSGILVEAISQLELRKALDSGFPAGSVVLNGPGKWWPARVACPPLRAVFCDSLVELGYVCQWLHQGEQLAGVVGIRLRPPAVRSRFGIDVGTPVAIEQAVAAVRKLPGHVDFGLHFHLPSELSSGSRRWSIVDGMLRIASRLQEASGRAVRTLDIGGGWTPDAFVGDLLPGLTQFSARATAALPLLREVLIEPGRGLAEPTAAVLTRVLEVRPRRTGECDVVVDAAVSELPDIARHPHRVFVRTPASHQWQPLLPGSGDVLGRSCMESDVLATGVALGADLAVGDYLAFCDAGAYDASKSYRFGCG